MLLKKLGFPHVSTKQDEPIVEAFEKNFPRALSAHLSDLPVTTRLEIWFQDEARIGHKNGLVRQWVRTGTRGDANPPISAARAPICSARFVPRTGLEPGSRCPLTDTEAMQLSRYVAEGAHATAMLDRAGGNTTGNVDILAKITLMLLYHVRPN